MHAERRHTLRAFEVVDICHAVVVARAFAVERVGIGNDLRDFAFDIERARFLRGDQRQSIQRLREKMRFELQLGVEIPQDPNAVDYYTLVNLENTSRALYGDAFADWVMKNKNPNNVLNIRFN